MFWSVLIVKIVFWSFSATYALQASYACRTICTTVHLNCCEPTIRKCVRNYKVMLEIAICMFVFFVLLLFVPTYNNGTSYWQTSVIQM